MIRRGQVHWVDFGAPAGRRPAIIVSNDRANTGHTVLLVVPITNTVPANQYPSILRFVELKNPGSITGCARFDALQSIPRAKISEDPVHILEAADIAAMDSCLRDAVGL